MSNTITLGDVTVHRIVEIESGSTKILESLPALTPERLAENRTVAATRRARCRGQGGALLPVLHRADPAPHDPGRQLHRQRQGARRAPDLAPEEGRQLGCAASPQLGLTVNDIDFVMCTHLHVDHVGWNTRLENGRWVPTFPKARYLFSEEGARLLAGGERQERAAADRRQRHPDRRGEALRPDHQRPCAG